MICRQIDTPAVSGRFGATFALFSNVDEPMHFSYKRYLDNQFREAFDLVGCPIHLIIRARKGMKKEQRR